MKGSDNYKWIFPSVWTSEWAFKLHVRAGEVSYFVGWSASLFSSYQMPEAALSYHDNQANPESYSVRAELPHCTDWEGVESGKLEQGRMNRGN